MIPKTFSDFKSLGSRRGPRDLGILSRGGSLALLTKTGSSRSFFFDNAVSSSRRKVQSPLPAGVKKGAKLHLGSGWFYSGNYAMSFVLDQGVFTAPSILLLLVGNGVRVPYNAADDARSELPGRRPSAC